ncbi:MAG: quinolinate synthase NadA [Prevotellaceae bacterium]|jgi:quinolinate synthase|nr:quinolinate synthase NadA [Prevotellaceae bacterium]
MKQIELISEINRLRHEKNAVIMAHYYQMPEIQDIADFTGDSLALAQEAQKTSADIIVLAGVNFMGETAKILNPAKKVLVPDINAGCSLADSCPAEKFAEFIAQHSDYKVVTYVNTTAEVKALSDICATSTNAKKIIEQLPENEKIIFAPDKNLGNYINSVTGRNMLLWNGACHVHEQFSVERLLDLKNAYPNAKVLAHPECKNVVLMLADFIGSTQALLNYATQSNEKQFLIATESGILHQMQKLNPEKEFIPVPPIDSTCGCNDCKYMRLNTLEKIYNSLLTEQPEILVNEEIRKKAVKPIEKMLKMSV